MVENRSKAYNLQIAVKRKTFTLQALDMIVYYFPQPSSGFVIESRKLNTQFMLRNGIASFLKAWYGLEPKKLSLKYLPRNLHCKQNGVPSSYLRQRYSGNAIQQYNCRTPMASHGRKLC